AERTLKQAEEERQAQARSLDEQIAAAVAAAIQAQATGSPTGNGARKPPAPPALEPTNDTDPSWCPIHRCTMQRRTNERGSWYSHRLPSGGFCKGEYPLPGSAVAALPASHGDTPMQTPPVRLSLAPGTTAHQLMAQGMPESSAYRVVKQGWFCP